MREKSTKEIALETGGKIVVSIVGFFMLKSIVSNIFSKPGLTTRVPYNYANTQIRKISLGAGQWYEVSDPWQPNDLAHRLHSTMSGVNMEEATQGDSRKAAWLEVSQLGIDRARWLHNYWLDKIDSEDTVYRWIDGEWSNYPEWDAKDAAMAMLTRANVGW